METSLDKPMIGLVVACHCRVAQEMVRAAELIVGPQKGVRAVSMNPGTSLDQMTRELTEAIRDVDEGAGVIVITDLFGGTPSNVALALADENIEVVSGANLPMLIKFAECRATLSLAETARKLRDYGRHHISMASEVLRPDSDVDNLERNHEASDTGSNRSHASR